MLNIEQIQKERTFGLTPRLNPVLEAIPDGCVLTCEQIASLLNVHVKSVRRWVRQGKIEAYSAGGRYAIFGEDFKRFLQRAKNRNLHVEALIN